MDINSPGLVILVLAMTCLYLLAREWNKRDRQLRDLSKRVAELEKVTSIRLPHRAADEILDAVAMLDRQREKQQMELDYFDSVLAHLKNALATGTKRETK